MAQNVQNSSSLQEFMPPLGQDLVTPKFPVTLHIAEVHYLINCPFPGPATYKIRLHYTYSKVELSPILIGNPMELHIWKLQVHSDFVSMRPFLARRWFLKYFCLSNIRVQLELIHTLKPPERFEADSQDNELNKCVPNCRNRDCHVLLSLITNPRALLQMVSPLELQDVTSGDLFHLEVLLEIEH